MENFTCNQLELMGQRRRVDVSSELELPMCVNGIAIRLWDVHSGNPQGR